MGILDVMIDSKLFNIRRLGDMQFCNFPYVLKQNKIGSILHFRGIKQPSSYVF